jgi:hypothetical protein
VAVNEGSIQPFSLFAVGWLCYFFETDSQFNPKLAPAAHPSHVITGYQLEMSGEIINIFYANDWRSNYRGTLTVFGVPETGPTAALLGVGVIGLMVGWRSINASVLLNKKLLLA